MHESSVTAKTVTHTPGPWTCHVVIDGIRSTLDDPLKATYAINLSGESLPIILPSEAEANARLISAAPDLLEALKLLHAESNDFEHPYMVLARAAIRKAEGGAQ